MPSVPAVRGTVETADLGQTLMHEHIFVLTADVQQNYPEQWGSEEARIADAVAKLTHLASLGVSTIVDPTVIGLGRYIPRIQAIAEQVDINILVATGCYTYDEVPFYFHYRGPALGPDVKDPMVDMFVRDLQEGIAGTGVRAAFLKCAIDRKGMTPGVERVMRAVAKAHQVTGAPLTVHTHVGDQQGLAVHKVLTEEGVAPQSVVLGHSGDTSDADHLMALADLGYVLGMDRFGLNLDTTFEDRAAIVIEMCRRGYAESMVLSQDASCYIDWADQSVLDQLPQWHYNHIHTEVLPYLREHGVTEPQVHQMLVDNPRRYFERAFTS